MESKTKELKNVVVKDIKPEDNKPVPAKSDAAEHPLAERYNDNFHLDRARQFEVASKLYNHKLVPSSFTSPHAVLLAIQQAISFGFKSFGEVTRAISQMYVVHNVVRLWGDLPLAILRQSGKLGVFEEYFLNKDNKIICEKSGNILDAPVAAVCKMSRKGEEKVYSFSLTKSELLDDKSIQNKDTWKNHLRIMWQRRLRKHAINTVFPDVFYGVPVAEYDGYKNQDDQIIKAELEKDFASDKKEVAKSEEKDKVEAS